MRNTKQIMYKVYPLLFLMFLSPAWADDATVTECASRAFADALAQTANTALETAHETDIQTWIYQTFALPDVLNTVLACPEIANVPDDETIKFTPIQYTFPGVLEIFINY